MGGRGATSATGTARGTKPLAPYNAGASSDSRKDLTNMFHEVGVNNVSGVDRMSAAVVGAEAIQLNNLERKFHVINSLDNVNVTFENERGAFGSVSFYTNTPASVTLNLNPNLLHNVKAYDKAVKAQQKSGFKVDTADNVLSRARYTVTHEYGHMLHNKLYADAVKNGYTGTLGQFTGGMQKSINAIAKRYGATDTKPSGYGRKNSAEFFAESFASANLGAPSAHGKALLEYLKRKGY